MAKLLMLPRPATRVSRALRARSVSGSVPESVPENRGVSGSVPRSVSGPLGPRLRSVQKLSRECPQSVWDTFSTLQGHSRDTFWTLRSPGPRGPGDTPRDTPGGTPVFGDTLGDTPGDTSGSKGLRDPCSRPGGSQPNSICSTPSQMSFWVSTRSNRPLQLFSVAPPSLPRRRALLRRIFHWKNKPFFRWKNIKHDQRKCKWWKIGTLFPGFLAQNPLDFVPFSAADNHIFFADAVGLTSLVLLFLSVLSPPDSTNYKQFLLWGEACCTPVFGPPAPLVDFAISRFVVWFFGPWFLPPLPPPRHPLLNLLLLLVERNRTYHCRVMKTVLLKTVRNCLCKAPELQLHISKRPTVLTTATAY